MYITLIVLGAISGVCVIIFGVLATFTRTNKKTYKILAQACAALVIIFAAATTIIQQKELPAEKPVEKSNPVFNINGDYINNDKIVTAQSENSSEIKTKVPTVQPAIKKEIKVIEQNRNDEPKENIINNGIINSGTNTGTQTVNNYNPEPEPRHVTKDEFNLFKQNIPIDYKILFHFENGTQESINYANEMYNLLIKMGYKIDTKDIVEATMYSDSRIRVRKGNRAFIFPNQNNKSVQVIILKDY